MNRLQTTFIRRDQQLLNNRQSVVGIQNGKARFQVHMLGFFAQNTQPQGVEGADRQTTQQLGIYQGTNTLVHFTSGLIGKSQRNHLPAGIATLAQQIRNFLRNHPCFATARSGQHQTGAVHVQHRLTLHGVQVGRNGMTRSGDGGGHGLNKPKFQVDRLRS